MPGNADMFKSDLSENTPDNMLIANVIFRMRVRDDTITEGNPFRWENVTTADLVAGKRVIIFSLPGAFTPTCSIHQLPDFERMYDEFKAEGIDEIFCLSVNDAFVMNAWAKASGLKNVKVIPDGSALFTTFQHMDVRKDNFGFGVRSWRYAMIVDDMRVEKAFVEPGYGDNVDDDPYGETTPQNILAWLKEQSKEVGRQLTLNLSDGIDSKATMS